MSEGHLCAQWAGVPVDGPAGLLCPPGPGARTPLLREPRVSGPRPLRPEVPPLISVSRHLCTHDHALSKGPLTGSGEVCKPHFTEKERNPGDGTQCTPCQTGEQTPGLRCSARRAPLPQLHEGPGHCPYARLALCVWGSRSPATESGPKPCSPQTQGLELGPCIKGTGLG